MAPELLTPRRSAAASMAALAAPTLAYSADGKFLFQREAHVVRVRNSKNGQLLHECVRAEALEGAGAGARQQPVVALALHPLNALQLLAAYADGKVLVWDFGEEKVLQEFDAKVPVLWMASSAASPSMLLLVVGAADDAAKWALVEFNMKKKRRGRVLLEQSKLAFTAASMQSYRDSDSDDSAERFTGDFAVVAAGDRLFTVRVQRDADGGAGLGRSFATHKFAHARAVTCVAVHPTAREFVVGDASGQLVRHHGAGAATTARLHWHAHAVACVAYSCDGQFLLSGGDECVLVSWHVESGRRAYLPRRSAPLASVTTRAGGAGYAVALADHVLFQYNHVTKEEEWHALGLARSGDPAAVTLPSRQLVFDPVSGALPLNGRSRAGVLQFYDPYKDRVLQSVVLTERNQVTRTEDEELPIVVAEHLQFSPSGRELVTLHCEARSPASAAAAGAPLATTGDAQALRFWKRREDGSFFVNTAIDAPHGREPVTSLAFSPAPLAAAAATGDASGEFKVWKPSAASASWFCQSVVRFRATPITALAFAPDGSLLAVAYGPLLTLWDVHTHALRHVLSAADGAPIRQVAFAGASSPFVVLTTRAQVQVWNLLSLELWWRYAVPEQSAVSVDARRGQFLVWLKSSDEAATDAHTHLVLVFAPHSPVPLAVRALDVGAPGVWSVHFHPKTDDLVVLDGDSNVWRVGDSALDTHRHKAAAPASDEHASAFAAMFKRAASSAGAGAKKPATTHRQIVTPSGSASSTLFEAPVHVLPSMTALYRSFMDTMLPKPSAPAAAASGAGDDDDDDDSSSKRQKKRSSKKRQKKQSGGGGGAAGATTPCGDDDSAASTRDAENADERQKRMKLLVEKELANPALQQQTYSKLLEAFRKAKKQPAH
ncbi:hypothetical protein PybrP1_001889 [[Pythium] brassicae (nom. inval.)]|nr:hypothetical protein PybrP1_001889 [[Pythium] brassicae (nom. inval.)]